MEESIKEERPDNDLKEFGVDNEAPDLFSSENEISNSEELLSSENLDQEDDFIGKEALREINIKGPLKKLMGAEIEGDPINDSNEDHLPVLIDGKVVGSMNAMVYSPRLDKNLSYVFLDNEHARVGQEIIISSPNKDLKAKLVDLPWLDRAKK